MDERDEPQKAIGAARIPRPLTSFHGRRSLLADLRPRLGTAQVVTLTGVGGAGKTRLALELAHQLQRSYHDGVRLVELASVGEGDPEVLAQVVLSAVGVPDQSTTRPLETLVDYLRSRRMLLVLDNCEHVADAVAHLVTEVAHAAEGVRVLATSRERLRVPGEVLVPVPPLELPDEDAPLDTSTESVALLVDRAEASVPGWRLTQENWPAVVRVLRAVAGIPLGIELAVVRLRSTPVDVLAHSLDDLMRVLNRNDNTRLAHHQTMAALIEWSHSLCTEPEQLLWARLSVFRGSASWSAVRVVCGRDDSSLTTVEVGDALAGLVDKSIVLPHADRGRFELPEPLRQFGETQLRAIGEHGETRDAHREFIQEEAARLANGFNGTNELPALQDLTKDLPNFRRVLSTLLTAPSTAPSNASAGLALAVNLVRSRVYTFTGRLPEGRMWLARGLAVVPRIPETAALRAAAILMDAWHGVLLGVEHDEVARQIEDAAELTGAPIPPVDFLRGAFLATSLGAPDGLKLLWRAAAGFAAAGPEYAVDRHLAELLATVDSVLLCDRDEAAAVVARFDTQGGQWAAVWLDWFRGVLEIRFGAPERALEILLASLETQRRMGDRWTPQWTIEAIGWAAGNAGPTRARYAAMMLGLAGTLQRATGHRLSGLRPFAAMREAAEQHARAHLGDEAYDRASAVDVGTLDQAISLVLGDGGGSAAATAPRRWAELTDAELKVARLAAEGLTNQQIAERLVVASATVKTHLASVFRKLGVGNRSRLAALFHTDDAAE